MSMTVSEMIEVLSEMNPDAEIRFASQPAWAFEYAIEQAVQVNIKGEDVVYLEEGNQIGYLPHKASVGVGWSEEREEDREDEPNEE